jgi:hypothetical protein
LLLFGPPLLLGCAGAATASRPAGASPDDDTATAKAPGEIEMVEPSETGQPPSLEQELSELEPIAVDEADVGPPVHTPRKPVIEHVAPEPIAVSAQDAKTPVPLSDHALILPGGLTLHRVPADVRVQAREGREVWDFEGSDGRLLARVHALSFSRAARPSGDSLLDSTRPMRLHVVRTLWGPAPVEVVVDRFSSDTHIYTLERRAKGTDWIWAGLELGNTD